jgi:AcrR family transcriptional regulator
MTAIEPPATSASGLRRDVARNRRRILDAAREICQAGEPLQLNAVARRAEVGVGTVYRHFATPEALLEGLVEHRFVELIELARDATGSADPAAALRTFLLRAFRVYADDPAFAAVTTGARVERAETEALRTELVGAFNEIVRRAARQLRPGLDGTDLLILVCGIGYSARRRPDKASEYLDALLTGLLADDQA